MKMTSKLRSLEDGGTEVTSIAEVNVVGILAQMGSRVISEVSNIMFQQFTKNFQAQLQQPADAAAPEAKNKKKTTAVSVKKPEPAKTAVAVEDKKNPDPKKEVRWGFQNWEEMSNCFVGLTINLQDNPDQLFHRSGPSMLKPVSGIAGPTLAALEYKK